MNDSTLKSVANHVDTLYEGQLTPQESLEAARNLTGFVDLLLEIAEENGKRFDDAL